MIGKYYRGAAVGALAMIVASGLIVPRIDSLAASAQSIAEATGARIAAADMDPANWLSHGRGYDESRHSPLAQINTGNVDRLGLAWFYDLDTKNTQEATPLVVDGIIYSTSAWSKVQALDGVTGELLWQFDPEVPGEAGGKACCDFVNRGVAYWEGKVFVGTLDGRLIALDATSGEPVWSTMTVDPTKPYTITGAPRVVKGKVVIGNGGAEFGVRGYVSAYDADTGEQAWRFYTVPGEPGVPDGAASDAVLKQMTDTWTGDWWKDGGGGGGTVWDSMAYDPELDLLYIGVGNSSYWNRRLRSPSGDNLFVASILALRPDTGEYVWHYQATPGDQWDYTSTQNMILTDLEIDGETRKVLMQAPKNGFFYILDRTNGELISAEPYTTVNWATEVNLETGRPVINPEADYSRSGELWAGMPGALGGHNWMPMAYDPGTGLVYIPEQKVGFPYLIDEDFEQMPVGINTGLDYSPLRMPADPQAKADAIGTITGSLLAWDPLSQREVWSVPHSGGWNGGLLTTAGHLVFQGDGDGMFNAFDSRNGTRLWSFNAQTGIVAAPVTWSRDGKQYVTIVVGWGGTFPLFAGEASWRGDNGPIPNRSRILTFALDAEGELPPPTPEPVRPLQTPAQFGTEAMIARGWDMYDRSCVACHGVDAVGGGILPDLRYSPAIANQRFWYAIVGDGALTSRGMVGFKDNYSPEELEALRAFVISRAHFAKDTGQK